MINQYLADGNLSYFDHSAGQSKKLRYSLNLKVLSLRAACSPTCASRQQNK